MRGSVKTGALVAALTVGGLSLVAASPDDERGREDVRASSAPAVPTAVETDTAVEVEASSAAPETPTSAEVPSPEAAAVVLDTQEGSASYYANMLAGRRTASGVRYDPSAAVAAHRELPFGTRLRVENLANGRVVEVEVVDRGPFAKGRILDLSRSAARQLDFIRQGHTRVRIEVLEYGGE